MRVLVAYGTKRGGTEGIARRIADELKRARLDVTVLPAAAVRDLKPFNAVIVGGALYLNRWNKAAWRLVSKNVAALKRVPVWLFSSGPLDDSADQGSLAPAPQVLTLLQRIGAQGHVTFGGRLEPNAKGFIVSAMAKNNGGDWRNPERIQAWAAEVARAMPHAKPHAAIEPRARSPWRLFAHALVGASLSAAVLAGLWLVAPRGVALGLHAAVAPLVFIGIAVHYFGRRGAREPMPTALAFTAVVAAVDLAVEGLLLRGVAPLASAITYALVFLVSWATGALVSTMPWPKPPPTTKGGPHARATAGA